MDIDENKKYQAVSYNQESRTEYINDSLKKEKLKTKVTIFVFLLLVISYIAFLVNRHSQAPTVEMMLNYMQEKYGEEFEVVAVNTQTETSISPMIEVISPNYPHDIISVATYRENGKRVYEDSYIPILRRDEFNQVYQELVSEVYKQSKTYINTVASYITLPPEINKDTKIEEILSNPHVNTIISVYVVDDISNKESQMEKLRLKLKEKKWDTTVDICYVNENTLGKLTFENRDDYLNIPQNIYLTGSMILSDDFDITNMEWGEVNE